MLLIVFASTWASRVDETSNVMSWSTNWPKYTKPDGTDGNAGVGRVLGCGIWLAARIAHHVAELTEKRLCRDIERQLGCRAHGKRQTCIQSDPHSRSYPWKREPVERDLDAVEALKPRLQRKE